MPSWERGGNGARGDYRDIGNGIKMPFRQLFAWLGGRDAIQLTDVEVNVPIDAARFGKPAPVGTAAGR